MSKLFSGTIALVGWFALIVQLFLFLFGESTQALPVAERIVRFFSFFTILTNLIVAITTTALTFFPRSRLGAFAQRASTQAAVAVYISIVGLVYSLFLRSVWNPQGWQSVVDHLLHDAVPLAFVIYWLVFSPKSDIDWLAPFKWLAYPVAYMTYSIVRGEFVDWYPYWFVDITQLGYQAALTNASFVLIAFVILGFIYVGLSRLLARR